MGSNDVLGLFCCLPFFSKGQTTLRCKGLKGLGDAVYAAAFVGEAGVDVEVHGGGDGGVAKDYRNGFVVAFAFDAAGGETVTQGVETGAAYVQAAEKSLEIIPIVARFQGFGAVGNDIEVR